MLSKAHIRSNLFKGKFNVYVPTCIPGIFFTSLILGFCITTSFTFLIKKNRLVSCASFFFDTLNLENYARTRSIFNFLISNLIRALSLQSRFGISFYTFKTLLKKRESARWTGNEAMKQYDQKLFDVTNSFFNTLRNCSIHIYRSSIKYFPDSKLMQGAWIFLKSKPRFYLCTLVLYLYYLYRAEVRHVLRTLNDGFVSPLVGERRDVKQ